MKKILILLFLFAASQSIAQDKFGLGVKVGQNFSSINNVAVDKHSASFHIGVTSHIGITPKLSIAPEVILSQTKLETNPQIIDLFGDNSLNPETYHLNYLAIPILAQYSLFKGFQIQAGPQYSILLDQKKDGIENATLAFKNGEFAMVAGAKLNLGGFFVYGRYVVGMENVATAEQLSNQIQDVSQWKSKQWQLGIGMNLFQF